MNARLHTAVCLTCTRPYQKYIHYIYMINLHFVHKRLFAYFCPIYCPQDLCNAYSVLSVSICCVSLDVIVLRDSPPPQLSMPNHQNQGIQ